MSTLDVIYFGGYYPPFPQHKKGYFMTRNQVMKRFKTIANASKRLELPESTIRQWPEKLDKRNQCYIEMATNGALKADRRLMPKSA